MPDDALGVARYWSTTDYLGLKADQQHEKAKRDGETPHTPISRYVNPETGFMINQFKSPRAVGVAPLDTTDSKRASDQQPTE